jgi:steroid 5-alpha reductase family enzyme
MVSLPVQVAAGRPERLGPVDGIGVAVVVIGLLFEIVGDEELRRFKADPRHRANGAIMTAGLWRYTRHPNYFGDAMVWWGVYVIALSTGWAWWTIVSPVMMSFLLISVSGKKLLESRLIDRPGYRDYVAATSGFFPLPPRRSSR